MISASLGLDISNFQANLSKAATSVGGLSAKLGSAVLSAAWAASAAAITAAAAGVTAAVIGTYKAMEAGGELVDLQERTGIAVESLMALQVGFQQAGLGAEEVGPTINKLQKSIAEAADGNPEAASKFQQLGISLRELVQMSPDAQLQKVGDAIARVENPTKKAQIAMELFGKSGGKMLALFAAGGMDEAARLLGNQGKLMAENAGLFDKITDTLGTAATKMQGFFVGMASAIAPQLMSAVEAFGAIDLSGIGQQIGAFVAVFLEAFNQGTLGALVAESLLAAGDLFVSALYAGLQSVFSGVARVFVNVLAALFSGYFLTMLLRLLLSAAQAFVGAVLNGLGAGGLARIFTKRAGENAELAGNAAEQVQAFQAAATAGMPGVAESMSNAFKTGMETMGPSAALENVKAQFAELKKAAEERGAAAREANATPGGGGFGGLNVRSNISTAGFDTLNSLAKIGGAMGGGFVVEANPALDEARKQTSVLEQIAMNTSRSAEQRQQTGGLVLA